MDSQLQLQFHQNEKKSFSNTLLISNPNIENFKFLPNETKRAIFESLRNFEKSLKKLKKLSNVEKFEDENENKNESESESESESEGIIELKSADVVEKEVEDEVEEVATPSPAMQLILDVLKR